jgi:hypothetical protein
VISVTHRRLVFARRVELLLRTGQYAERIVTDFGVDNLKDLMDPSLLTNKDLTSSLIRMSSAEVIKFREAIGRRMEAVVRRTRLEIREGWVTRVNLAFEHVRQQPRATAMMDIFPFLSPAPPVSSSGTSACTCRA